MNSSIVENKLKYNDLSKLRIEELYSKGNQYKIFGPEYLKYHNGKVKIETWYIGIKLNSDNFPRFNFYNEFSMSKSYMSQLHRSDGAAYNYYDEDGEVIKKEYYLLGINITENRYYSFIYLCKRYLKIFKRNRKNKFYNMIQNSKLLSKTNKDICLLITLYLL